MGKRARRLLALALIAASAVVLQAAPAVARTSGSIRLVGATSPVVTGSKITLAGRFRYGGNRVYVIQRAKPGTNKWHILKATKSHTTARGYYRATLQARWNFRYRALLLRTSTKPRRVSKAIEVDTKGWLQISAGGTHTCGIWYDHTLWCWGWNHYGQLGNPTNVGTDNPNPAPTQVVDSKQNPGEPQTWKSVSAGGLDTCGIRTDDTLWCWGNNSTGRLGNSANLQTATPNPTPLPVVDSSANQSNPQTWLSVSAGANHTCGIRTDLSLWCWGDNQYGALGNTAYQSVSSTPDKVDDSSWASVTTSAFVSCGIHTDGSLWCWGSNQYGQLGSSTNDGTTTPDPTPLPVAGGADTWASVAGSKAGFHICGTHTDDSLWCWGDNNLGQLANSTYSPTYTPAQVLDTRPNQTWTAANAGSWHTCGLRSDATLWCWGYNSQGELGDTTNNGLSTPPYSLPNPTPAQVTMGALEQTWLAVAAGDVHTCGIRSDHAVYCWGDNRLGELGHRTTTMGTDQPNPRPLRVANPTS